MHKIKMKFTAEQIDKALAHVNQKHRLKGCHFAIAREDHYQGTMRLYEEVMTVDEPVSRALGLRWCDELANWYLKALQEQPSIIVIDDVTGEIVGSLIIITDDLESKTDPTVFRDAQSRVLFSLLDFVDKKANVYYTCNSQLGTKRAFAFYELVVARNNRQRRIGAELLAAGLTFCKQLGRCNAFITVTATSQFSQTVLERLGFINVYEFKYADYIVDGEVVIRNTGQHDKVVVYVMDTFKQSKL